jgi:hypothetical protein
MNQWLAPASEYVQSWLSFQMRVSELLGCIVAIMHRDHPVLETAYGYADAMRQDPLTPRHRFRIASHSKSFTAAGIMKLREARRLRLLGQDRRETRAGCRMDRREEMYPGVAPVTKAGRTLAASPPAMADAAF